MARTYGHRVREFGDNVVTTWEAAHQFAKLMERVEAGETIYIRRYNKPVAVMRPITERQAKELVPELPPIEEDKPRKARRAAAK